MVKKNLESGNDKYGDQRLKLANIVSEILGKNNVKWCIENGTLLGAFRNNSFIINDDDFDIALFFENNAIENLTMVYKIIKKNLPDKYSIRLINTYCHKLEVYDSKYGNYILNGEHYQGANFHHVTIDLQAYVNINGDYVRLYKHYPFEIPKNKLFPFGEISINKNIFQCPKETENVLKLIYGYIGENAKYNPETKKYYLTN